MSEVSIELVLPETIATAQDLGDHLAHIKATLREFDSKHAEFLAYIEADEKRWAQLFASQKANAVAQRANVEAIHKLTCATEGLVSAWTTADNLQRFFKWVSAFGIAVGAVVWLVTTVLQ